MRFSIIVSIKDLAGMNIKEQLLKNYSFTSSSQFNDFPVHKLRINDREIFLYTISTDTIHCENIENDIETEFFVFATRHQSKSKEKTLSVHFPGNFSQSDYGGTEKELCTAPAQLLRTAYEILRTYQNETNHRMTLEATHHGPLIRKPVMFIEIGSTEQAWKDPKSGKIIADTLIKTIKTYTESNIKVAVGFGGTHYCPNFNKVEGKDIAMSHIAPKYVIKDLTKEMIKKMIDATYEEVDLALLDWKGMNSSQKKHLISLLEELNMPWKKTKDV